MDIHVLIVDLKNPGTSVECLLSNDQIYGREVVSSMALREAEAAVNADFSGFDRGIPEGLTVVNSQIQIRTEVPYSSWIYG